MLDEFADLLQNLTGKHNDRGGAVADFSILRAGDVDENAGSWMNDIEKLENKKEQIENMSVIMERCLILPF